MAKTRLGYNKKDFNVYVNDGEEGSSDVLVKTDTTLSELNSSIKTKGYTYVNTETEDKEFNLIFKKVLEEDQYNKWEVEGITLEELIYLTALNSEYMVANDGLDVIVDTDAEPVTENDPTFEVGENKLCIPLSQQTYSGEDDEILSGFILSLYLNFTEDTGSKMAFTFTYQYEDDVLIAVEADYPQELTYLNLTVKVPKDSYLKIDYK